MYLNSLIIGFVGVFAYVITTVLINAIGNRNILGESIESFVLAMSQHFIGRPLLLREVICMDSHVT